MKAYQKTDFRNRPHLAPLRLMLVRFALLCWGVLFCAGARAQDGRITLDVRNVPLEEAMARIEQQGEYSFLYNKTLLDVSRKVTLRVEAQPLRRVLDRLFAGSGIDYTLRGRQIILSQRPAVRTQAPVHTEQNVITGHVLDKNGTPLVGVSIIIEGTTNGTTTNTDGSFRLKANTGNVLTVSYLGFETTKVAVTAGRNAYEITLQESTEVLDDVVVVGYGVQKKASITGAITNISGKALKVNSTVNTSTALAGTIAGINSRMSDGRPGATTKISIRGMDSPL